MLVNTEGAIKNGQSRETGNIGYTGQINVREYRRGNQKWTIQRNWQHRVHKTKKNKRKTQHNMWKTPQLVHFAQANTNNVKKIIRHEPSYKQLEVNKT